MNMKEIRKPTVLWRLMDTDNYHCLMCHVDFCLNADGIISYCPCCGRIVADQDLISSIERWYDRRTVN